MKSIQSQWSGICEVCFGIFVMAWLSLTFGAQLLTPTPQQPDLFSRTTTSLELSWAGPLMMAGHTQSAPVEYYELQALAIYSSNEWVQVEDVGPNLEKALAQDEVQIITIRADQGQLVSKGWFQLALHFGGCHEGDTDCAVITEEIPADASSDQVEAALEALENIDRVRVIRCDEPGFLGSTTKAGGSLVHCPFGSVGGYSWHVRFDSFAEQGLNPRTHQLQELNEGDMPMLAVHKETITAKWTGTGEQVLVSELRRGGTVHASGCGHKCVHNVTGLVSGEFYAFRLRAHGPQGFSDWSLHSKPVATLRATPPPSPSAPLYSSSNGNAVTVSLSAVVHADLEVSEYSFQIKSVDTRVWLDIGTVLANPNVPWVSITATNLDLGTSYQFRAAATNAAGSGPWGPASLVITTTSGQIPQMSTPQVTAVGSDAVGLRWQGVGMEGEDEADCAYTVGNYHLQYQGLNQLAWVDAPSIPAKASNEQRAVLRVTTRAAAYEDLYKGYFWLSLDRASTQPISYQASSDAMKEALEAVSGAGTVFEVRRHKPGNPNSLASGDRGTYSWRIVWNTPNCPQLGLHKENLNGNWTGPGEQVSVESLYCGQTVRCFGLLTSTVNNLAAYTQYRFRVRAAGANEVGDWSVPTDYVRTAEALPEALTSFSSEEDLPSQGYKFISGIAHLPANTEDKDYVHGVGKGGLEKQGGGHGMVVILAIIPGRVEAERTTFFYTGDVQTYTVPDHPPGFSAKSWGRQIVSVLVKIWGAGGGGGGLGRGMNSTSSTYSRGGGGGFVQGHFKVAPGEVLQVVVGGGGQGYRGQVGGAGGYNGGAKGGSGQFGGAGGGGRSDVRRSSGQVLAVSGGGGGGGATDYCCSHGGSGGGVVGSDGTAPGLNTPVENSISGRLARTSEYSPEDCDDTECIDPRDTYGLPAEHSHIDYGLAAEADYSILSSAGYGATETAGGIAGQSGSYSFSLQGSLSSVSQPAGTKSVPSVERAFSSVNASDGVSTFGGRGADGKEGGGGGGGGWHGGGGGGSGVDAAGGGGGSGYVNLQEIFQLEDLQGASGYYRTSPAAPSVPRVTFVDHTHMVIEWDPPLEPRIGQEVYKYEIEVAVGAFSEEFEFIDQTSSNVTEYSIEGLLPDHDYRVRVRALSSRAFGTPGLPLDVRTGTMPVNHWQVIKPRAVRRARGGRGLSAPVMDRPHLDPRAQVYDKGAQADPGRYADPPIEDQPTLPSGRRGHTTNVIEGPSSEELYMFGGYTEGYVCDVAITDTLSEGNYPSGIAVEKCRNHKGLTNELWRFDPVILGWELLKTEGPSPAPREFHSGSVIDGVLYIFGGRAIEEIPINDTSNASVSRNQEFFNDVWMLDPNLKQVLIESDGGTGEIEEGKFNFFSASVDSDDDYCIADLNVQVSFSHPCTRQLQLSLYGPGPNAATANFYPDRAGYSRNLFQYHDWTPNLGCKGGNNTLIFDDEADSGIFECCDSPPYDGGTYRPVEPLSDFKGMPASGEWTLSIYDRLVDGTNGNILNWTLSFTTELCDPLYTWVNVTPSSDSSQPPARFQHTAIAVENQFFVWGGYDENHFEDMWRFDTQTLSWTELKPSKYRFPEFYGRASFISPWGLISFGGYHQPGHIGGQYMDHKTWIQDLITEEWSIISISNDPYMVEPHLHRAEGETKGLHYPALSELAPTGRYGASVSMFLVESELLKNIRPSMLPSLVIYGGYNGVHYGHELHWLTLSSIATRPQHPLKESFCSTLLSSTTIQSHWNSSCQSHKLPESSEDCNPHNVVQRAWCLDIYQSCGNL